MVYPRRLVLVGMLPFRNEIHLLMEAQQCQFAVAYLGPFLAGGADDAAGKMRYADSGIGRVHMLPPPRTWRRTARHSSSTPCNSSFKHIAFVVFFLFFYVFLALPRPPSRCGTSASRRRTGRRTMRWRTRTGRCACRSGNRQEQAGRSDSTR